MTLEHVTVSKKAKFLGTVSEFYFKENFKAADI